MEGAIESLTEKQRACLRLVYQGYETKEIAPLVGLAPATVDRYIERATKSLGCNRRSQAARVLARHEGQSERSVSERFGPDDAESFQQIDLADRGDEVREGRQTFVGFEPVAPRDPVGLNSDKRLSPMQALGRITVILLTLLAIIVLVKPGAQSVQEIVNWIQPPKHH